MNLQDLHRVQGSILWSLKYNRDARFSELMKETALTSDDFKFHLLKLRKLGLVIKNPLGSYSLTAHGKEIANDFDQIKRSTRKHPKVSVLLVLSRQNKNGDIEYLMQERARNPFYGYWSEITMGVMWGESFEAAARNVLFRQTGLSADFNVNGIRRVRDFAANSEAILEDKLFVIMVAQNIRGALKPTYAGGQHAWLTLTQIKSKKHFESTPEIIRSLDKTGNLSEQDIMYELKDY